MSYDFNGFRQKLNNLNLTLTEQMEEQFSVFYELLIKWNQVMNLTAITEFDEVVEKHFLDSVVLGVYYNMKKELTLIDVGTGAGFPGIPLKIMFPDLKVVLADSLNKRVRFLNEVIQQSELKNILAVHGRAEELAGKAEYREQFDLCVSRAVANLACLSEYCIPFVKTGGIFVSYKSGEIDCEVNESQKAVQLLGGRLREVQKFQLPDTEYQRSFVWIDKVERTPKQYPRKAGTPARQPLGIQRRKD